MKIHALALALAGAVLAGCAGPGDVEMPSNSGAGSDRMRGSPCACLELRFDGQSYRWAG